MRRYTVTLIPSPATGGYSVFVPALPGRVAHGPTVEVAIERAKEDVQGWIEELEAYGEPLPEETTPVQTVAMDVRA